MKVTIEEVKQEMKLLEDSIDGLTKEMKEGKLPLSTEDTIIAKRQQMYMALNWVLTKEWTPYTSKYADMEQVKPECSLCNKDLF